MSHAHVSINCSMYSGYSLWSLSYTVLLCSLEPNFPMETDWEHKLAKFVMRQWSALVQQLLGYDWNLLARFFCLANQSIMGTIITILFFLSSFFIAVEEVATSQNCTLSCQENFFCDVQSQHCFPQCPEWSLFPSAVAKSADHVTIIFGLMGLIAGMVVLVVSGLRRRKVWVTQIAIDPSEMTSTFFESCGKNVKNSQFGVASYNSPQLMQKHSLSFYRYVFPSVFVVYQTVSFLILSKQNKIFLASHDKFSFAVFFHLVLYIDRSSLFCTSRNLLESIVDTTSFCVVSGNWFSYES